MNGTEGSQQPAQGKAAVVRQEVKAKVGSDGEKHMIVSYSEQGYDGQVKWLQDQYL